MIKMRNTNNPYKCIDCNTKEYDMLKQILKDGTVPRRIIMPYLEGILRAYPRLKAKQDLQNGLQSFYQKLQYYHQRYIRS